MFLILKVNSQELPLINRFSPEDYNAESQNWSISQSENGFIYVANNKGLLEFNGASWNLYPTPNQTIMRSVKAHKDKIFTGFYMDFGYWQKDEFGILNYTSLVKENKIKLLSDEQFWNIIELDGWILFQSLQRIYIYNLNSDLIKVINSDTTITKMFKVDDSVYFQKFGEGIFKIEKGISKLLSDKKELRENVVVLVYKKNQKLIFLTQNNGFYTLENEYELSSELSDFLKDKSIYNAKQLSDGSFVLGTISNGAFYVKPTGEIQYVLNQKNGLSNNTVLTTFEDKKGDIWLGLDNGIDKIDVTSSFRIFKDPNGTLGTVYTAIFYKEYLYLGTNQGLFSKKYPSTNKFSFIKNTQGQVWSLDIVDDTLFCGHNNGTFIINGTEANLMSSVAGTWGVKQITNNKLLQGNYDGLYILEKK